MMGFMKNRISSVCCMAILIAALAVLSGCANKKTVNFKINSVPKGAYVLYQVVGKDISCQGQWIFIGNTPLQGVRSFSVISADGADMYSRFMYLETKGEMEEGLVELEFDMLNIYRPPLLHASDREEFRLGEVLGGYALNALWLLVPLVFGRFRPLDVERLAEVMLREPQRVASGVRVFRPLDLYNKKNV